MILARLLGGLLLVAGVLPIANWIDGGHDAPWLDERVALWSSGGSILLGVAAIVFIVMRRHPRTWGEGAWQRLAARWIMMGWRADLAIGLLAMLLYAAVAHMVFSATPLLIDELVQVWQARVLASGRLWVPTPAHPEFTAIMHLVDVEGRRFGQFPIGGPLMLMLGTLIGAEWLVGPVFAGLAVLCWARLLRGLVPDGVGLAAVLLLGMAPFWMFLGGSMMNHVTATAWLLVAALALARSTRDGSARLGWAFLTGAALGLAAMIRPIDAVAFALPTAAWLLWRLRGGRAHLAALAASGAGVAGPVACLLYVNAQQTGAPLRFGYVALWGASHAVGFHDAPWGPPHTPLRGLELVNLYLLRLQTHLYETPAPGLLFAVATLLLVRGLSAIERWAVASSLLLLLAYWAYWHDGFYLGPRFLLPLVPWLVLWTARLPRVLGATRVSMPAQRAVLAAGVVALVMGAAMLVPIRWRQYANAMRNVREDVAAALQAAGVHGGTVMVRETWGSQLIARLWARGVTRAEAERVYRTTDGCLLHEALAAAEGDRTDAAALLRILAPARADSSSLSFLHGMPDTTVRVRDLASWTAECRGLVLQDTLGSMVLPPALLAERAGFTIVRDLHRRPPGTHPPYWLVTTGRAIGAPIRVELLDADSLARAWDGLQAGGSRRDGLPPAAGDQGAAF